MTTYHLNLRLNLPSLAYLIGTAGHYFPGLWYLCAVGMGVVAGCSSVLTVAVMVTSGVQKKYEDYVGNFQQGSICN